MLLTDDDAAIEQATDYVRGIARALGYVPDAHPSALAMAESMLGRGCIERAPMREESTVARLGGRWRAFLNARLPASRQHWALAMALSRWALARDGAALSCSAVAAAILMPAAPVSRALARIDSIDVARRLVVPEVAAALRAGELTARPIVHFVPGQYARIRGDRERVLPRDRHTLEGIVSGRVALLRARKISPSDGRGVLLLAA